VQRTCSHSIVRQQGHSPSRSHPVTTSRRAAGEDLTCSPTVCTKEVNEREELSACDTALSASTKRLAAAQQSSLRLSASQPPR
jgi:hypothetical protein